MQQWCMHTCAPSPQGVCSYRLATEEQVSEAPQNDKGEDDGLQDLGVREVLEQNGLRLMKGLPQLLAQAVRNCAAGGSIPAKV